MQTESILSILEGLFNKREGFSKNELASVNTLTISRISLDNEPQSINFSDLYNFPNLEVLTIDSCTIDLNVIKIILEMKNILDISFYNCDIVENIYPFFEDIELRNVIISNCNINMSKLGGIYDTLTVEGSNISDIRCFGITLDIFSSNINNINFLEEYNFEEIVISKEQYDKYKDKFDNCERRVVVMEDNGQFIYIKVGF